MKFKRLFEDSNTQLNFNTFLLAKDDQLLKSGKELLNYLAGPRSQLTLVANKGDGDSTELLSCLQVIARDLDYTNFTKIIKLLSGVQVNNVKNKDCYKNFVALAKLYKANEIDLSEEFLSKTSLYNRGSYDFSYAVKVLKIAHDPSKLKQVYGDNENIKVEDLYKGSEIKPSGALTKSKDDISTIYGTVEMWKRLANGESSVKPQESSKYPTFSNFEKALKSKSPIVNINGTFRYNKNSNSDFKWEPVN